jgi:hypothetical protein
VDVQRPACYRTALERGYGSHSQHARVRTAPAARGNKLSEDAMGLNMECVLYLQKKGHLTTSKNKLLDIGPQNVYLASPSQIEEFLHRCGVETAGSLEEVIQRLSHYSHPRPGERTTLLSQLTDLTTIEYNSFDVCPALKTELLDLNYDALPRQYYEYYDLVLNFGTTEHIMNQWNCFSVIHEATKVGGIIYCVLPASGYLDHGYYCYTPVFFRDMAAANDYVIVDKFLVPAIPSSRLEPTGFDVRTDKAFMQSSSASVGTYSEEVPSFNIHVLMRKTKSAQFQCALEIATADAPINAAMAARYGLNASAMTPSRRIADLIAECQSLLKERDEAVVQYQRVCAERDARLAERDEAVVQYQRVCAERDARLAERDEAVVQYQRICAERDARLAERDSLVRDLESIRQSTAWRITAPMRRLAILLRGGRRN